MVNSGDTRDNVVITDENDKPITDNILDYPVDEKKPLAPGWEPSPAREYTATVELKDVTDVTLSKLTVVLNEPASRVYIQPIDDNGKPFDEDRNRISPVVRFVMINLN
jgi:hypothetical protein